MRGRDYRKKCKNPQYRSGNREGRRFAKHMNRVRKTEGSWEVKGRKMSQGWP